jgi:hypothetical protein
MLKKSKNSASIQYDSRKRRFSLERYSEKVCRQHARILRSLRLWTFFITFVTLFRAEYATIKLSLRQLGKTVRVE